MNGFNEMNEVGMKPEGNEAESKMKPGGKARVK